MELSEAVCQPISNNRTCAADQIVSIRNVIYEDFSHCRFSLLSVSASARAGNEFHLVGDSTNTQSPRKELAVPRSAYRGNKKALKSKSIGSVSK